MEKINPKNAGFNLSRIKKQSKLIQENAFTSQNRFRSKFGAPSKTQKQLLVHQTMLHFPFCTKAPAHNPELF